jgi:RimJ/RimL family protein N-acetyltransferase
MPWAHEEPQPIEAKVELLRRFRGGYDLGTDFVIGIFDESQQRALGGCGLHPRGGPRSLEIGYWVRADATRQGIGSRVCALLTRTAFDWCGIERLDIKVEPGNEASVAIPRRLGFHQDGLLRAHLADRDDEPLRDALVFTMLASEFPNSAAATATSDIDLRWLDSAGIERDAPVRTEPA